MSFIWYPAQAMMVLTLTAGGGGSDVVGTDTVTLSEAAVAQLLPVATDSFTLSESATSQGLVLSVDAFAFSDSGIATSGGANQVGVDTFTLTEQTPAVVVPLAKTDSATLTEAATSAAILTGSDSGALSETGLGFAAVVATDTLAVSDAAVAVSGGNAVTASDAASLSEVVAITTTVVASETETLTDAILPVAAVVVTDSLAESEASEISSPFIGIASITGLLLLPRIGMNGTAGAASVTWDSSLITFDSTLTTFDGGYLAPLLPGVGLTVRGDADLVLDGVS